LFPVERHIVQVSLVRNRHFLRYDAAMRLLLLSNSTSYGGGYLDHAEADITGLFSGVKRILFVPFALHDQPGYWARARQRFAAWGIEVDRAAEGRSGRAAAENADGIFVGGGNTFRLLHRLQQSGMVDTIRKRALEGMPYMGASAGTVIAGPTIMTTNDMPIVQPATFEALRLVPFQLNCHFLDADPDSRHMGETREVRLLQYLEENDATVVGLREGAILSVTGTPAAQSVLLRGTAGARVYARGTEPAEFQPGQTLFAK